jgi:hypothetical protein
MKGEQHGNAEAQAEYDKLKGLLEELSRICESKDKILDKAEAALKGVGNADALRELERNLRGARLKVLSELAGITKHFGG